jgi:hypothetical protein
LSGARKDCTPSVSIPGPEWHESSERSGLIENEERVSVVCGIQLVGHKPYEFWRFSERQRKLRGFRCILDCEREYAANLEDKLLGKILPLRTQATSIPQSKTTKELLPENVACAAEFRTRPSAPRTLPLMERTDTGLTVLDFGA